MGSLVPKMLELPPPGGRRTRLVGRVMFMSVLILVDMALRFTSLLEVNRRVQLLCERRRAVVLAPRRSLRRGHVHNGQRLNLVTRKIAAKFSRNPDLHKHCGSL